MINDNVNDAVNAIDLTDQSGTDDKLPRRHIIGQSKHGQPINNNLTAGPANKDSV